MFIRQGESRTKRDNLSIAIILSFVAGIVNVSGYLAFNQLTTNVTGHFALFVKAFENLEFWKSAIYFLYIFSFLFGSFVSSFFIEKFKESKRLNIYVAPTIVESVILISIGLFSNFIDFKYPDLIICLLLYAMGVQNSFVTKISNAVVRTTHLTGLFTDLGIDLSQLFFQNEYHYRAKLKSNIKLRISIILFFFSGGVTGGFLYSKYHLNTLILAAFILLGSLFFEKIRIKIIKIKHKYTSRTIVS